MEITKTNNPVFKTNIKCVSPKFFNKKTQQMFQSPQKCELIDCFNILPSIQLKNFCGYRTNMTQGFTNNVRTCTAGVVVNKGERASLFMHVLNSYQNKKNLPILQKFFNGTNAILIGSKNMFTYSRQIFDKLKKFANNQNLPLTIMQGLPNTWQANLAYNSDEDTLYLCVNNAANESEYVKNIQQLKKIFSKVEISPSDNIEFLSRFKEFLLMIGFTF